MATKKLASMTDEELAKDLVTRLFEANVLLRATALRGMDVAIATIERPPDALRPGGYTEIQAIVKGLKVP